MVLLKNYLFCIRLKTAGLVFGWLGIVSSICGFFRTIFECLQLEENYDPEAEDERERYLAASWIIRISFAMYVFALIISALIIVAIKKNRPKFLLPWLITSGLVCAIAVLGVLFVIIPNTNAKFAVIIVAVIFFALQIYHWLVIYSLYREMISLNQQRKETRANQAHPALI